MEEIVKLKARAYDCMANLEFWQKELQIANAQIKNIIEEQSNVPKN